MCPEMFTGEECFLLKAKEYVTIVDSFFLMGSEHVASRHKCSFFLCSTVGVAPGAASKQRSLRRK